MDHGGGGILERATERPGAVAIAFEQVKSHALRRFRPDTRQDAQGLDQPGE